MNVPGTIHLPDLPPPQLLLTQFCPIGLPVLELDPQLLHLRATTVTAMLWEILDKKGHRHGGLNE